MRLPFELPYRAGDRPADVTSWPGEGEKPYALPFHPLELGEDALRALCGFVREGCPEPDDVDADAVELYGFHVRDAYIHDLLDCEIVIVAEESLNASFVVTLFPEDLEDWEETLAGLEARRFGTWLDSGRTPSMRFKSQESGGLLVSVHDGPSTGVTVTLPLSVPPPARPPLLTPRRRPRNGRKPSTREEAAGRRLKAFAGQAGHREWPRGRHWASLGTVERPRTAQGRPRDGPDNVPPTYGLMGNSRARWLGAAARGATRSPLPPPGQGSDEYRSGGRFEIAAAIAVRPLVLGLLRKRLRAGRIVAPRFEGPPRDATVGVVAAGAQDAARVRGEVSTVAGERGVFGEEERGDDGGFTYILVAVMQEGRDGPVEHRAQVPEGRHGGAAGEEAGEVLLAAGDDLVGGVVSVEASQPNNVARMGLSR
ncbi:DUF5959 family protein [Streptomyces sp. NPDC006967]|uniref:DUF6928 family protein n=1 Tax=Streptomyces sp. NPDC006967 TaxID=3156906 RepID=UPI0033F85463